jgi:uncharacterized membrane protein
MTRRQIILWASGISFLVAPLASYALVPVGIVVAICYVVVAVAVYTTPRGP